MNTLAAPFTPVQRVLFLFSISLSTLLFVLDYSIANIAIPYIAGGLAVSTNEGIYVITFFSIGSAISLAMTGWLTRTIGQTRLLLTAVFLFTFFSWLCGLSPNLLTLVILRFIQGFASAPLITLSQAFLIQESAPGKQARDLSIWSTVVITGPVLGPLIGGYISYWYHWSWIFYVNIPLGILCFTILWFILRDRESVREKLPSDWLGVFFLCVAVTSFQIVIDKGQDWDWWDSIAIRSAFIAFLMGAVFFVSRELSLLRPVFQVRLLKILTFTLSIILLSISYAIYFGSIVLVPLWIQEFMGYDAIRAGIAVAPLGIAPALFSLVAPKLMKKFGNIPTIGLSFAALCISSFYTATFTTEVDIIHIGFSRFLMGFGFICYIAPLAALCITDIQSANLSSALGIFHFFRALSGALGASLFTTLWQRRIIFHHERIGSTLSPFNFNASPEQSLPSLDQLNRALDKQAAMLSINDAFYLMGWLFVISIVLLLGYYAIHLLRKKVQVQ